MTEHSIPRRTVIGGGIGLGVGLATGVVQAQAQTPTQSRMTATKVGMLTSTAFGDFQNDFEAGWTAASPGTSPNYVRPFKEAKGKYDSEGGRKHRDLPNAVDSLNRDADVIIAAGGMATAHAIVKKAQKPFLVLIGRVPDASDFDLADNENYFGGVDLRMVETNPARVAKLMSTFSSIPRDRIWLLYNPNSRMSKSEVYEWTALGGKALPATAPFDNNTADFGPAYQAVKNRLEQIGSGTVGAVVISGDPFFTNQRNPLVTAANQFASQIKTCYPFDLYNSTTATPPPTTGTFVIVGPKLSEVYNTLGQKAAKLAADPTSFQGLDPALIYGT